MRKTLTISILISLLFGLIVGLAINLYFPDVYKSVNYYLFQPLGDIFINLIQMVVVPLVFFSIVMGVVGLGDPKKLGRIGLKTIGLYVITTVIAVTIALSLANVFNPGEGTVVREDVKQPDIPESPPLVNSLVSMVPSNPFEAMTEANMMQVILFALFVGVAIFMLGKKVQLVSQFCEQANQIMMRIVFMVMYFAPFGAFGLMASAMGKAGINLLSSMAWYMMTIVLALLTQMIIVYGVLLFLFGKMNLFHFYRSLFPAMETAFATSSSAATLPITMQVVQDKLNVNKGVSSFVLPLGATINMDGTAIMQGVAAIFIAQLYQIDLSLTAQLTILLTAVLGSIGTAAVPSAGIILLSVILAQAGLPPEGIGIVLGVDRLLDMTRTMTNITGDATVAVVVDRSERKRVQAEEKEATLSS